MKCSARTSRARHSSRLVATVRARRISDFPRLIRHSGEEFVHVLRGKLVMHTDLYEPLRPGPGDSCYFDSNMGHALVAVSDEAPIIMWVCSMPWPAISAEATPANKHLPAAKGKPANGANQTGRCRATVEQTRPPSAGRLPLDRNMLDLAHAP
jgi:hypothetical protein